MHLGPGTPAAGQGPGSPAADSHLLIEHHTLEQPGMRCSYGMDEEVRRGTVDGRVLVSDRRPHILKVSAGLHFNSMLVHRKTHT